MSLDLRPFQNLRVALLRNNRLSSVTTTGLTEMLHHRAVDLRGNAFSDLQEAVTLVRALPELRTLGFGENPCTTDKWRFKFLKLYEEISRQPVTLRVLDER